MNTTTITTGQPITPSLVMSLSGEPTMIIKDPLFDSSLIPHPLPPFNCVCQYTWNKPQLLSTSSASCHHQPNASKFLPHLLSFLFLFLFLDGSRPNLQLLWIE